MKKRYITIREAMEISSYTRGVIGRLIYPSARNGGKPPVKTSCSRAKGAKRGARRILLSSFEAYLKQTEDESLKAAA